MQSARLLLPISAALAVSLLSGCGTLGPNSIKLGRISYNDVIHQTSGDQLLLNLVRIHNHEIPLFMEITEVDASVQVQTTITGGTTGIGAHPGTGTTAGTLAGQVSSIAGGAQYTETPTIRYQPLQGAALIAQLNSPISVDSLVYMSDSGWPLEQLLLLTVDRLTPGYSDFSAAGIALVELEHRKALIVEATQLDETAGAAKGKNNSTAATMTTGSLPNNGKPQNNALTLFFEPRGLFNGNFECESGLEPTPLNIQRLSVRLWLSLLKIYRSADVGVTDARIASASSMELQKIISMLPASIEIPAASFRSQNRKRSAPVLRTRSALGVLKRLAEEGLATFASPDEASKIINKQPNKLGCSSPGYYYVVSDAPGSDNSDPSKPRGVTASLQRDPNAYPVLMLIQVSDTPPTGAFVSAFDNGNYYFIAKDDEISKRTLALLALITSIQAKPSEIGGLTPALTIGPR
jgi:hypothetical protein